MHFCKICGAEYVRKSHGRMTCDDCDILASSKHPRFLTLEQRFWSKCFKTVDGCIEFGTPKANGRPSLIMADGRQVPPSHVALWLARRARPSLLHSAVHRDEARPMCCNHEHYEWVEDLAPRGPMWAHLMTPEQLMRYVERQRQKRAQYQRNFRRKLKEMGGVRSVREARHRVDTERTRQVVAAAALIPDPNSIQARKARTLARWEAMTPEEQGAAVDQLPALDQLPADTVERVRELVRRAEALGVPAEIAREYVMQPLPAVAAVPLPVAVPAPSASSLGAPAASPAAAPEPEIKPAGLEALFAGARIAAPD